MNEGSLFEWLRVNESVDQDGLLAASEAIRTSALSHWEEDGAVRFFHAQAAYYLLSNPALRKDYVDQSKNIEILEQHIQKKKKEQASRKKDDDSLEQEIRNGIERLQGLIHFRLEMVRHAFWKVLLTVADAAPARNTLTELENFLHHSWFANNQTAAGKARCPAEPQLPLSASDIEVTDMAWRKRRERAWLAIDRLQKGIGLPIPSEPAAQSKPRDLDTANLKIEIVAAAICEGDYPLLRKYVSATDFTMTELWQREIASDLDDVPEFESAVTLAETVALEPGKIPAVVVEELGFRALETGKHHFAHYSFRELGILGAFIALLRDIVYEALGKGNIAAAARAAVTAADLELPGGPEFQNLGQQLHARCWQEPANCPANRPPEEQCSIGIQALLGFQISWGEWISRIAANERRALFREIARIRDPELDEFRKNYEQTVEYLTNLEMKSLEALAHADPETGPKLAQMLVGYRLLINEYWFYLRELGLEHPPAMLLLCVRPVSAALWIVPILEANIDKYMTLFSPSAT